MYPTPPTHWSRGFPVLYDLTWEQATGNACVVCGAPLQWRRGHPAPTQVGESGPTRHQVYACRGGCASRLDVGGDCYPWVGGMASPPFR